MPPRCGVATPPTPIGRGRTSSRSCPFTSTADPPGSPSSTGCSPSPSGTARDAAWCSPATAPARSRCSTRGSAARSGSPRRSRRCSSSPRCRASWTRAPWGTCSRWATWLHRARCSRRCAVSSPARSCRTRASARRYTATGRHGMWRHSSCRRPRRPGGSTRCSRMPWRSRWRRTCPSACSPAAGWIRACSRRWPRAWSGRGRSTRSPWASAIRRTMSADRRHGWPGRWEPGTTQSCATATRTARRSRR